MQYKSINQNKGATMKKILLIVLSLILVNGLAFAQGKGKEVSIVGEVVETQCYITGLTGSGKGEAHKPCAVKSASNGIPLSILEDKSGTVYLTGQAKKAMTGTNDLLSPFIAEKVKVSGKVFEKGGMKFLLISKVEKLGDAVTKEIKKESKKAAK
jgi:hypothetical protein